MSAVDRKPVVVHPGQGHRVGNVEFLARTADTPRFTFGIIEFQANRTLEAHVHADEDDAFYILEGELTFVVGDDDEEVVAGLLLILAGSWLSTDGRLPPWLSRRRSGGRTPLAHEG